MTSKHKLTNDKTVILKNQLTTPLGEMIICATENGICLLEFEDRIKMDRQFKDLKKLLNADIIEGENDHIHKAKKELDEYFEGNRKSFDIPLEVPGTDFQKAVWNSLQEIEYGTTSSYQQQAENIHNPKAIRAVASTNGNNRIAIIIPCHRVIGKNGKLTGYSGGIDRKKWLLEHEKGISQLMITF